MSWTQQVLGSSRYGGSAFRTDMETGLEKERYSFVDMGRRSGDSCFTDYTIFLKNITKRS